MKARYASRRDAAADIAERSPSVKLRFAAAFSALDAESGGNNYVTLAAMRAALPDLARDIFDRELHALRRARVFTLDASVGQWRTMTAEENEAGITEAGRLLVWLALVWP